MNTVKYFGLTATLLFGGTAQAFEWSDWEVRPHVGTGLINYEYKQQAFVDSTVETADDGTVTNSVLIGDQIEAADSLLFAEVGVSAFLGNFFFDISYQKSDEGKDDYSQDVYVDLSSVTEDLSVVALGNGNFDKQREMEREELAVSIGYAVTDNFGVYAGYKRNDTQFDDEIRSATAEIISLAAADPIEIFGQEIPIGSRAREISEFSGPSSIELEQSGFFIGATYVLPFESDGWFNGALSFDLGLAFLDGDQSVEDLTMRTVTETTLDSPSSDAVTLGAGTQNTSGDAVGINVGIAWSGPLTERLSYSVGVDGYQYDYESDGVVDFQDTVIRVSAGVSYAIDSDGFR